MISVHIPNVEALLNGQRTALLVPAVAQDSYKQDRQWVGLQNSLKHGDQVQAIRHITGHGFAAGDVIQVNGDRITVTIYAIRYVELENLTADEWTQQGYQNYDDFCASGGSRYGKRAWWLDI